MNPKDIKLLRTESLLKELVPEALSELEDPLLSGLCVTDVKCSRGKYDASVYLDKMMLDENEQNEVLSRLKKASGFIQTYCAQKEGWFRAPKFSFVFDEYLEKQNKIDDLFEKINIELERDKHE